MKTTVEQAFADFFYMAVLSAGGSRYTAHMCLAQWWKAVDAAQAEGDEQR